jgi:hypothetical protein
MHGCIQDQVFADEEPTITAQDLFVDGTPFTITISGTVDPAVVGAASYSINGSALSGNPTFYI